MHARSREGILELRSGLCICDHVTEISCIRGALLGSLGSSLDSAAHLANFFMSVSPDVPMDEMASALFRALEKQQKNINKRNSQELDLNRGSTAHRSQYLLREEAYYRDAGHFLLLIIICCKAIKK